MYAPLCPRLLEPVATLGIQILHGDSESGHSHSPSYNGTNLEGVCDIKCCPTGFAALGVPRVHCIMSLKPGRAYKATLTALCKKQSQVTMVSKTVAIAFSTLSGVYTTQTHLS